MRQFTIVISAIDNNNDTGCDVRSQPGQKLHNRCGRLDCVDCLTFDYVQALRMRGYKLGEATFTNSPGTARQVVDDLVGNRRVSGTFLRSVTEGEQKNGGSDQVPQRG